jgi:hypothetical protein
VSPPDGSALRVPRWLHRLWRWLRPSGALATLVLLALGPAEAAITVPASAEATDATSDTNYILTLPSGIVNGSMVLCGMVINNASVDVTPTWPGGYTVIFEGAHSSASAKTRLEIAYHRATGVESGTITVTAGSARLSAGACYRIEGAHATTAPECSPAGTEGTDDLPNSPDFNPAGWGTEETLWITWIGSDANFGITTSPSGYSNVVDDTNAGNVGSYSATRLSSVANENPAAWDLASADEWVAATCAVRPAEAVTGAPRQLEHYRRMR